MRDFVVPAWGEASGPLLPAFLRGWLADQPAPQCMVDWLGRPVICAELDGHVWATSASPLDPACLREVAVLVGPLLEPFLELHPLPPVRGLGLLVAELPLRTRTINALTREGLLGPHGGLESRTLAELTDIRNFGTVSLLDLLCVVEAALTVSTASAAADIAGARPGMNALTLHAWGARGIPMVPVLFRTFLHGEPAPPAVQRWLDHTVNLDQLDEQIWSIAETPPPYDLLPAIAASLAPVLRRAGSLQPFPRKPALGPVLSALPLRPRTMNALSAAGYLDEEGRIEEASLDQLMKIPNFGMASLIDLLCVAEAGLPTLGYPAMPSSEDAIQGQAANERDLRIVAAWAVGEHGAQTASEVLELSASPRPQDVEASWQHILRFSLRDFAGDLAQTYSPPHVVAQFLAELDDRETELLRDRVLQIDAPATLDEIGRRHDVSRQRVRQIEVRVKDRLATLVDSSVGRLAVTLMKRLGTAVPAFSQDVAAVDELVHPYSDPTLAKLLLLYLAGPYRADDGWILHLPSRASLDGTQQSLLDAADQAGIVSDTAVADVLERAGIRRAWHDAWISKLGCLKRVGDNYLRWDGTTLDRLERLLRLRGKPATAEELLTGLDDTLNARGIKYRLMEDTRFVRINKQSQFALPEWGFDEYTGITDEIAQEIERCGGVADADHLVRTISSTYGVAETSVRAYLGAPMFTKSSSGTVSLRGEHDEKFPVDIDLSNAPDSCFTPDGWSLRIVVDSDVLRGSGKSISEAFAAYIGVEPGNKVNIPGPESMITVSWPQSSISGPRVGSLRVEALALDAVAGDLLFLVFLRDRARFETRRVRASDIEAAQGTSRLALLHGLRPSQEAPDTLTEIARAFGVEIGPADDAATIVDLALTRRRQDFWRSLVPVKEAPESLDDILERLAKALG